jgi:phosphoglycerate dehydrogenase-like enzyme
MIGYKRRKLERLPEGFDEMIYDLDGAIDAGDIVVVALPATDATVGLLDRRRLSRMEGKFLVNIGRGNIVEEKALYDLLSEGVLRGAAIDCWYSYPDGGVEGEPSNYPIRELGNVVLSPHIAGFTAQSVEKNVGQAVENLAGFLRNGTPRFEALTTEGY